MVNISKSHGTIHAICSMISGSKKGKTIFNIPAGVISILNRIRIPSENPWSTAVGINPADFPIK